MDKYHTIKGQRMDIRRSAYLINQKVVVNTAQLSFELEPIYSFLLNKRTLTDIKAEYIENQKMLNIGLGLIYTLRE